MAKKPKHKPTFKENVLSFGMVLLAVLMLRSSIVESVKVPSGSMLPTILLGDFIFVNKFAFGLKIPFSDFFTDSPIYIIPADGPERGEIVVFDFPRDESIYFIKRVVGLPGDTFEVINNVIHINGSPVSMVRIPEEDRLNHFAPEELKKSYWNFDKIEMFKEKMGEHEHVTMFYPPQNLMRNFGPIQIPEENYFMMGDNRDDSGDSRSWGFVHRRLIKGKAMIIWMSLFLDFEEWDMDLRLKRSGKLMH